MAKARLHDDAMVQLLREDPGLAQYCLHQAFIGMDEEGEQEAFLLALRHLVEARGEISERAGVGVELKTALSPGR